MAAYKYDDSNTWNIVKPSFIATIHKDTYPAISPTAAAPLPAGFAVFVTGASKGIGRAMPIAFAQAGASHIAFGARGDVSSVKTAVLAAAKAAGRPEPQVLALQLDVTDRASVAAAAQAVEVAFGKVDVVVNNAALMENWASILDVDPDEWWRVWEVNVRGVFEVTRALLPLLLRGTGKTVVNVGSQGGHLLSPGASAYQTSKFALMRLSEFLCCEYAEQGLVAWTAHPAGVATDMSHKLPPDSNFREILTDTPELPADGTVLLTREHRPWLAGRYLDLTWDLPELLSREKEIVDGDKLKMRAVL